MLKTASMIADKIFAEALVTLDYQVFDAIAPI